MTEYDYGMQPWHKLWLYGIVLDDDRMERLVGYWNPEGSITGSHSDYYVPDDHDTTVSTIPVWGVLNSF